MPDGGVGFGNKLGLAVDAAWGADAPDVVPHQINNHGQLGPVLGGCEESPTQLLVFGGGIPPGGCSLDRSGDDMT
jgi:hypothetical protein